MSLPSDLEVGDRVEFVLTGLEGFEEGLSLSIDLSSEAEIASLGETLLSSVTEALSGSSLEVLSDPDELSSEITLRSSEEFDVSVSQFSNVIEGLSSTFVEAAEDPAEGEVAQAEGAEAEDPAEGEPSQAEDDEPSASEVGAHVLSFDVPTEFTGIDVVSVSVLSGQDEFTLSLDVEEVLSDLGEEETASSLFADAFVSAFAAEFSEATDISSEVVVTPGEEFSTVVLSSSTGPMSLSVEAESREVQTAVSYTHLTLPTICSV